MGIIQFSVTLQCYCWNNCTLRLSLYLRVRQDDTSYFAVLPAFQINTNIADLSLVNFMEVYFTNNINIASKEYTMWERDLGTL